MWWQREDGSWDPDSPGLGFALLAFFSHPKMAKGAGPGGPTKPDTANIFKALVMGDEDVLDEEARESASVSIAHVSRGMVHPTRFSCLTVLLGG